MFGEAAMLYFDHNATHPLSRAAREAWLEATERYLGNPSSPHRLGSRAEAALSQAREKLAGWLGCEPADIVWTSGATEANNAAVHSAAANGAAEIWISAIEHPCALAAAERYFGKGRRSIPVTREGIVDIEWLGKALRISVPGLVGVMAANNETGVLQPWREVLALCREGRGFPQGAGEISPADRRRTAGGRPSRGDGKCRWRACDDGRARRAGGSIPDGIQ
jgi:cysteine desulfurase